MAQIVAYAEVSGNIGHRPTATTVMIESRLTGSFSTQAQAIERGRDIARNQGAELRIQGSNGQFREAWSYGNDPYPPKG